MSGIKEKELLRREKCKEMYRRPSIFFIISYVLFLIIGLYILGVNIFMTRSKQYWMYYDFPVSNTVLFIIALVLGIGLFYGARKVEISFSRIIKAYDFKLLILILVLFALQCFVVHNIFFYVDWDVKYLREAALQCLSGRMNEFYSNYFHVNPNNLFMLGLTVLFFRIGQSISVDGYMLMVYFGVLLNTLSVLFSTLSVRKLSSSDSKSFIAFILSGIFFGMSPWLIVPYSDTFSLLFPVLTFYIFISVRDRKISWIKKVIIVTIIPALTYLIKPTNIFILLGIGLYEIVILIKANNKKETILKIVSGAVFAIVIIIAIRPILYSSLDYKEDESVQKPMAHYLLLGSNEGMVGMYSTVDDEYTNSFVGMDNKTVADLELVKERYSKMGINGYGKHLSRKTYLNYANGIFGWGKEQHFVNQIAVSESLIGETLQNVYYVGGDDLLIDENAFSKGGKYFSIYASICQVIWYVVIVLCIIKSIENCIIEIRKKEKTYCDEEQVVIAITLIGMFTFLSLFETNARYLYSLLPLYVVYIFSRSYGVYRSYFAK